MMCEIFKLTKKHVGHLICLAIALHMTFVHAKSWPKEIVGRWQVIEVHINEDSSRTTSYKWNDPRLVGRLFEINLRGVSNDTPESNACESPRMRIIKANPQLLIQNSMAAYGYPPKKPDARGYHINLGDEGDRSVFRIYCNNNLWQSGLGADSGLTGAWMILLPSNRILLRWYDETLLILERVMASAAVKASFDCSKASNQTERTICGSYQLSAFDKSVTDAYNQLLLQARETDGSSKSIVGSQRTWVKQRNACGSNKYCILNLMKYRLEWLANPDQI